MYKILNMATMQAKPKRGRKPLPANEKKKAITVYIKTTVIEAHGGLEKLRKQILKQYTHATT